MDSPTSTSQVLHADYAQQQGFTQTENVVLRDTRLSVQARFLYTLLKMHAWQRDSAFPGQETLAELMGVKVRMVQNYLKELLDAGLVARRQRGPHRTNCYILAALNAIYCAAPEHDTQSITNDTQWVAPHDTQPIAYKEDSVEEDSVEEDKDGRRNAIHCATPPADPFDAIPGAKNHVLLEQQRQVRSYPKPSREETTRAALEAVAAVYPRRGTLPPDLEAALPEYAAVTRDKRPLVLLGAQRYAQHPDARKEGGQYVMSLARFIREGHYARYAVWAPGPARAAPTELNPQQRELERRRLARQARLAAPQGVPP